MFITMNFAVDIQHLLTNNILLLESNPNIVISGSFTKVNYITEWFTMNGLYIMFPVEPLDISGMGTKLHLKYNPYTPYNASMIQELIKLEHKLLDMYIYTRNANLTKHISLSRQLQMGNIKVYKEMTAGIIAPPPSGFHIKSYMIKVSGIWESNDECGITYKLFEAYGYSA
jgi:hypothetical protein